MSRTKADPCGCKVKYTDDGTGRYIVMCDEHEAEYKAIHTRAMEDYRRERDNPTVSTRTNARLSRTGEALGDGDELVAE